MKGNANQIGKDMSCQAFGHLFSLSMRLAFFTVSWTVGAFSSTCLWPHKSQELEILLQQPKDLQGLPILWRTLPRAPPPQQHEGLDEVWGNLLQRGMVTRGTEIRGTRGPGGLFQQASPKGARKGTREGGKREKEERGANWEIERNYVQG